MPSFLAHVMLGLSLAAPIGPVNAAQLDKGARFGFAHAWLVGLGAVCADALYMMLIYFGLAHFLSTPFMKAFLWLFGCFVLIYTGIESLNHLRRRANEEQMTRSISGFSSFRSGFWMSLLNPLSILFWLGIYGSILAKSAENGFSGQTLWHTLGIFTGLLLWDLAMAVAASTFKRFANSYVLHVISAIAGISLIGFGLYFGWQAYILLTG